MTLHCASDAAESSDIIWERKEGSFRKTPCLGKACGMLLPAAHKSTPLTPYR